jgi:hypothetical protein
MAEALLRHPFFVRAALQSLCGGGGGRQRGGFGNHISVRSSTSGGTRAPRWKPACLSEGSDDNSRFALTTTMGGGTALQISPHPATSSSTQHTLVS